MFLPYKSVYACSCAMSTVQESRDSASFVFTGHVTSIISGRDPNATVFSSADPVYVTFQTSAFWKGTPYTSMVVSTATEGSSCGYAFTVGKEYLVYTYQNEQLPETSICNRTAPQNEAQEDLRILGQGVQPAESLPAAILMLVPTATIFVSTTSTLPPPVYPYPSTTEVTAAIYSYPSPSFSTENLPLIVVAIILVVGISAWIIRRRQERNSD